MNAYARLATHTSLLHSTEQTANILRRRTPVFAAPLLADLKPLKKARYLRRWARRLREFGFSPEDAVVLAYGSFGVAENLARAGVEMIVTADLKLASRYEEHIAEIELRFHEMADALAGRYSELKLPEVLTTTDVLKRF